MDPKQCSSCEELKTPSDFYSKGNRTDNSCKTCRRLERRKRYKDASASVASNEDMAQSSVPANPSEVFGTATIDKQKSLLSKEDVYSIAEALLILETWQADLDAQRDLSNSKQIQEQTKE